MGNQRVVRAASTAGEGWLRGRLLNNRDNSTRVRLTVPFPGQLFPRAGNDLELGAIRLQSQSAGS